MSVDIPGIAFALTTGVFTIFSPCGYALLPGYVSYYLGSSISRARALYGGLSCTLGLVTVFSAVGLLASALGSLVPSLIPLLDLVAAALLIALGLATLLELRLPYISVPVKPSTRRGLAGFYLFGVVYGLAGVGCSAPLFLSVLLYAAGGGVLNGLLTFVAYAVGMGVPLVVTSVLIAEAKEYAIGRMASLTPGLRRLSGVVLVLVGLYLIYFYYITYVSL